MSTEQRYGIRKATSRSTVPVRRFTSEAAARAGALQISRDQGGAAWLVSGPAGTHPSGTGAPPGRPPDLVPTPTVADILALTDHFQDLLFDAVFPSGAPRDDRDIPVAEPEDWAHEARAIANAVAPFLRVVDGQLVAGPGRTIAPHLVRALPDL